MVEDDNSVRNTIQTFLELEGYTVDAVSSTREALERLRDDAYPIVISDIYVDERTGLDVLETARKKNPKCAVILMTARGTIETVMKATQGGAFDYIAKPFELDRMLDTVKRAEASVGQHQDDKDSEIEDLPESEMIGSSPKMIEIYKTVSLVAPTNATVLLEGETGTGKEMIARMVHNNSPRANQPFVPVDCGSIAPSLLESELFGALKGAYTGADRDRMGVFEAANNGTVFLDEIGDLEFGFQLNLLRFLQEKEIRPLGSPRGKESGRARGGGHQSRFAEDGGAGQVSRGPVVSPQRGAHHTSAVSGTARRCSPAGALFPEEIQRALPPAGPPYRVARCGYWKTIAGRATCATCST